MNFWESPFIVPLGAFAVAIVAIVSGVISKANAQRIRADQRMAMLARGIPLDQVEGVLGSPVEDREVLVKDPMRSLGNARRTAVVLISSGLGLVVFFVLVSMITRERDVLSGAAVGIIPLTIGIGFLIDYRMQIGELARFGMEVGNGDVRSR